jgi:hypothetical protein
MLPAILKLTADSKAHRQTYNYHVHRDASVAAAANG